MRRRVWKTSWRENLLGSETKKTQRRGMKINNGIYSLFLRYGAGDQGDWSRFKKEGLS